VVVVLLTVGEVTTPVAGEASPRSTVSGDLLDRLLQPSSDAAPEVATGAAGPGPTPVPLEILASRPLTYPRVVAKVGDLELRAPSVEPLVVGFHEAATTDALMLEPIGQLEANRNATRGDAPPDSDRGGSYLILHSRGRAAAATSAVDVVMRDGDPVRAPVSGVVSDIRPFALGGRYDDLRIEITPTQDPDLRVIVIHVDEATVAVGDDVVAGETMLAQTARRFPFFSQIDQDTAPERWPHVHIEVKPASAVRPGELLDE